MVSEMAHNLSSGTLCLHSFTLASRWHVQHFCREYSRPWRATRACHYQCDCLRSPMSYSKTRSVTSVHAMNVECAPSTATLSRALRSSTDCSTDLCSYLTFHSVLRTTDTGLDLLTVSLCRFLSTLTLWALISPGKILYVGRNVESCYLWLQLVL